MRRVYDTRRGFTTALTLDRAGRRVAFATCCNDSLPTLVVARALGGAALEPLKDHPEIDFVGGIGWSPDGKRLAFEGTTGTGPDRATSLWTIRPDGTDLQHLLEVGPTSDPAVNINEALVWTKAGVLYTHGWNMRLASGGESTLVMRRVFSVRISGDNRHLIITRGRGHRESVWISSTDGTSPRRLFVQGELGVEPSFYEVTPNYDASRLLAYRMGGNGADNIVSWKTENNPTSASIVDAIGYASVATWN